MPEPRTGGRLALSIQLGGVSLPVGVDRARVRRWVAAALDQPARLTIRLIGRAEGRELNRLFRGKDYATNVLTFVQHAPDGPDDAQVLEADIAICLPVVRDEARTQRKALRDHLAHLVIHGVLHARGLEHETDEHAAEMESIEVVLLRRFGIDDPYRER